MGARCAANLVPDVRRFARHSVPDVRWITWNIHRLTQSVGAGDEQVQAGAMAIAGGLLRIR